MSIMAYKLYRSKLSFILSVFVIAGLYGFLVNCLLFVFFIKFYNNFRSVFTYQYIFI
jgi:hypothetical protein